MLTTSQELGDGLILRRVRPADLEELAEFNGVMLADDDHPYAGLSEWTRDLFDGRHQRFRVERDATVVEDTATGRIVSAMVLIPQEWSYAGVLLPVGQPELVATHPDYRRRGLVRAQFAALHERSREAGHLWQVIGGIPWYYRQFGYSYALDVPPPPVWWAHGPPPEPPPELTLRAAVAEDVPFLATVEAAAARRPVLACLRGREGWALELTRRPDSLPACEITIVERRVRPAVVERVGYLAYDRRLHDGARSVVAFELAPAEGWLGPTGAALVHLADRVRTAGPGTGGVAFRLPAGHPALRCAARRLSPGGGGSYGLYVRVPDLVAMLSAVAPALAGRLADSPLIGYTGSLELDLYAEALRLSFEHGELTGVERHAPGPEGEADAGLPHEAFLHLLFGNRSLGDVEATTPDFQFHSDRGAALIEALFPRLAFLPWEMG